MDNRNVFKLRSGDIEVAFEGDTAFVDRMIERLPETFKMIHAHVSLDASSNAPHPEGQPERGKEPNVGNHVTRGSRAARKRISRQGVRTSESGNVRRILETPADQLTLDSVPHVHDLERVIEQALWVLAVVRRRLNIESLSPTDVSRVLSLKFGVKRGPATIAKAFERYPQTVDNIGGRYRIMKPGEDLLRAAAVRSK